MNTESSRSHSVFTLEILCTDNKEQIWVSRVNMVDLAGSENLHTSGAVGIRAQEGNFINM